MKRLAFSFLLLMVALPALADSNIIRDIDIKVSLFPSGNAVVHERWDVHSAQGTEMYLVRSNLGDIEITNYAVIDETGEEYVLEDGWDVDRSIDEKAGRCGINPTYSGCELCWGIGSYGDHVFHPIYIMTNVVKSLNDYDMLHIQFISSGLSSAPKHARVKVVPPEGVQLDTTNTRLWGFGYEGTVELADDGTAVFEAQEGLGYSNSMIVLMRFNKGIFNSSSVQERDFQEALDIALENADFGDDDDDWAAALLGLLFMGGILYLCFIRPISKFFKNDGDVKKPSRREKKAILGCAPSAVSWWRDPPFEGDLLATSYTMTSLGEIKKNQGLAAAMILRMVYGGQLDISNDEGGKVLISFNDGKAKELDRNSSSLYQMMKTASGSDKILQDKEFSSWAFSHSSTVISWTKRCEGDGENNLKRDGCITKSAFGKAKFLPAGQEKARQALGFKKFLDDFTLVKDKSSIDVHLWQEYLVYAALFGMSGKVTAELKDIDPSKFREIMHTDYTSLYSVVDVANTVASSVRIAATPVRSYSGGGGGGGSYRSYSGYGGSSSSSGGSGYSGGGHGGGFR